MGKWVGWWSWVNFIWSSPDFRIIIYNGNGHISPATKTEFEFVHTFGHPTEDTVTPGYPLYLIQLQMILVNFLFFWFKTFFFPDSTTYKYGCHQYGSICNQMKQSDSPIVQQMSDRITIDWRNTTKFKNILEGLHRVRSKLLAYCLARPRTLCRVSNCDPFRSLCEF